MKLVLICDEEKIYEGDISQISIVTDNGEVKILPKHQPYMTKVLEKISYTPVNGNETSLNISEGFVYTNGNTCFVVVDK
ncbi:MAG: hypothetical protein IJS10_03875 [Alphaproteobacteria bacterium]|nr:hypothetical protein [Alphaproteobacteria bacterium]